MIHTITGTVHASEEGALLVQVGPLALEIAVPASYQYAPSTTITLYTILHWNQETGPQLFGFCEPAQKSLFLALVSCPGIGPKIALTLLSQVSVALCIDAIQTNNLACLSSIKGIGPKKAEAIMLHLRSRIDSLATKLSLGTSGSAEPITLIIKDVYQALQALKYTPAEIDVAVRNLQKESSWRTYTFDQCMRRTLACLAKKSP